MMCVMQPENMKGKIWDVYRSHFACKSPLAGIASMVSPCIACKVLWFAMPFIALKVVMSHLMSHVLQRSIFYTLGLCLCLERAIFPQFMAALFTSSLMTAFTV